jgi:hypothetical protein
MKIDIADVAQVLAVCAGEAAESPAELVALARKGQPSCVATLFSAWETADEPLGAVLRAELDAARSRIDFYRAVAARLLSEADGLTAVKGLEVAALYPAGLVRYMNDLDYVATRESDLWPAVTVLTADGWDLDTATFLMAGGRLHTTISLRRPHEDRFQLPYGIELTSYYALGDLSGVPPLLDLPDTWRAPAVKNLLMLLNERHEQPFRARDVIDAALLHDALRGKERDTLHAAVTQRGLVSEYAELRRLVSAGGLGALPAPPGGAWTAARARAVRLARSARSVSKPVTGTARHLQRRLIMGTIGRGGRASWTALERRMDVARALEGGLLAFGLPLDGPRPGVKAAELHSDGKTAWMDTPAGRFLLTIGDEVAESAVAELSAQPVHG